MKTRGLTKRQQEVLLLLTQGLSNKEIARLLSIAEPTVKIHVGALLHRIGARNRAEAAYMQGMAQQLREAGGDE